MPQRSLRALVSAVELLTATSMLVAATGATAQPAVLEQPDRARLTGLADFIDGVLAQQLGQREVAGAVVSVVSGDRILFSRGYGFANVERAVPADPAKTLFRPGSSSKLFTWTALMQLVEQGRIDLDAEVNSYLDFKIPDTQTKPILVRHLLDHSLGFEDRGGIRAASPAELMPLGKWLAANIPIRVREPGVETSYSNYGTALAGYVVERVSREPFADYAERHIFRPLGMNDTTFREPLPPSLAARMAQGYDLIDGRFVARLFELYGNIMPAGAATSTANDMAKFMLAHLNDGRVSGSQILKPGTAVLMHSNLSANTPALPGFAHGFYVIRENGPRLIGHGGNTAYFHSMLLLAPEADFGIFVSYTGGDGASAARTELIDAVIGRVFPETPAARWTGSPAMAPVGSYRTNRRTYSIPADPANDVKVAAADGGIVIDTAGAKTYWKPVGPRRFQRTTAARAGGPFEDVVFHGDGPETLMSFESQPMVLYHRVEEPSGPAVR